MSSQVIPHDPVASRVNPDVPLAFRGVERMQILCLLQAEEGVASETDRARICEMVSRLATHDNAIPVSVISLGDAQVMTAGRLTLLVHASLAVDGGVAFTMRPFRPMLDGSEVLFGSRPRVAQFDDDAALETAIAASLDEILPWRARNTAPRKIDSPTRRGNE
ncbi:hypothetical protein [Croceicoccus hydrothermalis]|uniref:hypothetical protein n=1 Tax=Croceicoccus hydrothermalis TaxID=2867964 RepID=UPI001EFA3280|nr:hypothetical protein [Croceicoccus hydrothermalis]